jgi:hypothetical protein
MFSVLSASLQELNCLLARTELPFCHDSILAVCAHTRAQVCNVSLDK